MTISGVTIVDGVDGIPDWNSSAVQRVSATQTKLVVMPPFWFRNSVALQSDSVRNRAHTESEVVDAGAS